MKLQNKKTWFWVFLLISVEQIIKIIINHNFLHKRFAILPPVLYFEPTFNRSYSWYNSMLQLGVGKWVHVAVVAVMTLLIYLFYQYLNRNLSTKGVMNVMFAFIFSAAACSLIDKVFWNGSLDYILVNGFFVFDLKDVYINVFIGLLIVFSFIKNNAFKQIEEEKLLSNFIKFLLRKPEV